AGQWQVGACGAASSEGREAFGAPGGIAQAQRADAAGEYVVGPDLAQRQTQDGVAESVAEFTSGHLQDRGLDEVSVCRQGDTGEGQQESEDDGGPGGGDGGE